MLGKEHQVAYHLIITVVDRPENLVFSYVSRGFPRNRKIARPAICPANFRKLSAKPCTKPFTNPLARPRAQYSIYLMPTFRNPESLTHLLFVFARPLFCSRFFAGTQIAQPAPLPKPFQQIQVSLERAEPDLSRFLQVSPPTLLLPQDHLPIPQVAKRFIQFLPPASVIPAAAPRRPPKSEVASADSPWHT